MTTAIKARSEAVERLHKLSKKVPEAAIVLGSGVEVLEDLSGHSSYSFKEIFGIAPTVEGHSGSISLGTLGGRLVAVLRGRFHFYEGHDQDTVTLPVNVLADWGVPNLYLTNACGAMNPSFSVGDLMLITSYRDHINPRWKELGMLPAIQKAPIDCQNKLTKHVWQIAESLAKENKDFGKLQRGVFTGWLGPCYETLAEIEMFKRLGADTVGMSTVPELEAAAKTKMQAAAIAVITNSWSEAKIHGHKEVLEAAKAASKRLDQILQAAISSQ